MNRLFVRTTKQPSSAGAKDTAPRYWCQAGAWAQPVENGDRARRICASSRSECLSGDALFRYGERHERQESIDPLVFFRLPAAIISGSHYLGR